MFAKFSPDGGRVAYVRENNLYVENLGDGRITQLTKDGSRTIINGTFDWVYEEELSLRDGFRWSPDGRRIAYWQLDASGVRDFLLINNTDSLYSFTIPVQYPKAGTTNSAARAGVVSADGGPTVWLKVPGDPRNNYIARMDWAASSERGRAPASQPAAEHRRGDAGRRGHRGRAHRAHRARQRLGGRGGRPALGGQAARASPGSASGTGGGTCTSSRATGRSSGWSPRARSTCTIRSAPSAADSWRGWIRRRAGSTTARHRRTRPSSTSIAAGSTARASPSG